MTHFFSPRVSLRMALGSLVSLLLVALGTILTLYSFETQKQSTVQKMERLFNQTSLLTDEKLASMFNPVHTFVDITAELPLLSRDKISHYSEYLPYMARVLQTGDWVASVYVGYGDGSFYMLTEIADDAKERSNVEAPEDSVFLYQEMRWQGAELHVKKHFLDADIHVIEQREEIKQDFDPRMRPWYKGAMSSPEGFVTDAYLFYTTGHIGYTVSKSLADGSGVVGVDMTIQSLSDVLHAQRHSPSTELLMFDSGGQVLLSSNPETLKARYAKTTRSSDLTLVLDDLDSPVMKTMYVSSQQEKTAGDTIVFMVDGERWLGSVKKLPQISHHRDIFIATASPFAEIMVDARKTRLRSVLILVASVCIAVTIGLLVSRRLSLSLQNLSDQSASIRQFKLDEPLSVHSSIKEVDDLATNMTVMQSAILRFVEIARALSAEKDMERVIEMIIAEAVHVTGADGGGVGLVADDEKTLSYVLVKNDRIGMHLGGTSGLCPSAFPVSLDEENGSVENQVRQSGQSFMSHDVAVNGVNCSVILALHEEGEYKCQSLLVIPLLNRQDEMVGVLHLINARSPETDAIQPFSLSRVAYVEALSSNAALALDNNRLIRAQKDLFDSFVKLIASAIDTKSPYTGGHCQRVPVLSSMLAEVASSSTDPAFAQFNLTAEEKYELHVASWLHDCGKVTTPEYVVDKATKLETIYNRIHEVRTRFELLWRDAEITYLQGVLADPEQQEALQQVLTTRRQQLRDDFDFTATCNLGGEFMAPERTLRLRAIAAQTWERYFDDRLGLSADELARCNMQESADLPCTEQLLVDKDIHVFKRFSPGENKGFCMKQPELLYNQGELYNLEIGRGTLNDEERYKINDHVVQTITMLSSLPFPREIRRVPSWAGNHHEKLDGTGYPRCLTGDDLSFPERIMVIADIFEALSAADRPYKKPKKLSQCIKIMANMRARGHICPELFRLFLTSGMYHEYAVEYMRPDQLDEVDVEHFTSMS